MAPNGVLLLSDRRPTSVISLSRLVPPVYGSIGDKNVTIWYSVGYKSLKNLWHAVTSFRREQKEERRRESRLPAHGLTRIRWEDERQGSRTEMASLLGTSEHGCSFRTPERFAINQKILVEAIDEGTAVDAVVRHCESDGSEYIVGAEFIGGESAPGDEERQRENEETQSEVTESADQNN